MLKTYVFRNAGPETLSEIALDTETVDTLVTFDVSWRYQHFEASGVSPGVAASVG